MKLSSEQKIAVETKDKYVVVVSCAGAGKTATLTQRLSYLLDKGENPSNIFAITFTNMAADEMKKRLGEKAKGCYIGTIHGLANWILLSNRIDTSHIIDDENFDELFSAIKENRCKLPRVKHLLVDEFQDTGKKEYDFLMNTLRPESYFLVGDTRQKIYSFKTGEHDFFAEQIDGLFTEVYQLTNDYRNKQEIIDFGNKQISKVKNIYRTPVKCARGNGGTVIEEDHFSQKQLRHYLDIYRDFKNWFILCRTNNEVDSICAFLKTEGIPNITFKKADKTANEIEALMNEDCVKVLTIHAAKGLERKNVMVVGVRYYNDEEKRIAYVAATRAEDLLIWFNGPIENDKATKKRTSREERREKRQQRNQQKEIQKKAYETMEDWG